MLLSEGNRVWHFFPTRTEPQKLKFSFLVSLKVLISSNAKLAYSTVLRQDSELQTSTFTLFQAWLYLIRLLLNLKLASYLRLFSTIRFQMQVNKWKQTHKWLPTSLTHPNKPVIVRPPLMSNAQPGLHLDGWLEKDLKWSREDGFSGPTRDEIYMVSWSYSQRGFCHSKSDHWTWKDLES